MSRSLLALALAAASLAANGQEQAAPAATTPQVTAKPPIASAVPEVAATAPVITVDGVCTAPAGTAATKGPRYTPCKTQVTKAEFENLLNVLNPSDQNITPAMRRNLAQAYVELLTSSQAARKAGLDSDPGFLELMRFVGMRTLQDFYRRKLEDEYRTLAASEVQAYYDKNLPKYEEIKLSRIFIPAKTSSAANNYEWEKKAAQLANDVHDRAAKGEDFEKLQKEAYTTLGLTQTPPTTLGLRRRGALAPQEAQEVFALKAGEVSKLEQEAAGYIIYKVESKQTLPLEKVKDEISRELLRQKMDAQMKSLTSTVHADFNEQYFGPAPAPPPGRPSLENKPATPPAPK